MPAVDPVLAGRGVHAEHPDRLAGALDIEGEVSVERRALIRRRPGRGLGEILRGDLAGALLGDRLGRGGGREGLWSGAVAGPAAAHHAAAAPAALHHTPGTVAAAVAGHMPV